MATEMRVCPFCGEPPGIGVFCLSCGRNLADVEQLPTRAEWQRRPEASQGTPENATPLAGIDEFLAAMHAAGDPGVVRLPESRPGFLGRARHAQGWIVRPVVRDATDPSKRYTRGIFLSTGGRVHLLESTTRGGGQRDAPHYLDTVGPELEASPRDTEALLAALAAILGAHGVGLV